MSNSIQLSVRIDEETDSRIRTIMNDTGKTKSQVVKNLLNQTDTIEIKDGRKIAVELMKIHLLLAKNEYDQDIKNLVEEACNLITKEIYNVFKEDDHGDIESN